LGFSYDIHLTATKSTGTAHLLRMDSITVSSVADPNVFDPGSEFFQSRIPVPGVKKAPDPGSATLTVSSLLLNVFDWQ
jgi:hypothetical protein